MKYIKFVLLLLFTIYSFDSSAKELKKYKVSKTSHILIGYTDGEYFISGTAMRVKIPGRNPVNMVSIVNRVYGYDEPERELSKEKDGIFYDVNGKSMFVQKNESFLDSVTYAIYNEPATMKLYPSKYYKNVAPTLDLKRLYFPSSFYYDNYAVESSFEDSCYVFKIHDLVDAYLSDVLEHKNKEWDSDVSFAKINVPMEWVHNSYIKNRNKCKSGSEFLTIILKEYTLDLNKPIQITYKNGDTWDGTLLTNRYSDNDKFSRGTYTMKNGERFMISDHRITKIVFTDGKIETKGNWESDYNFNPDDDLADIGQYSSYTEYHNKIVERDYNIKEAARKEEERKILEREEEKARRAKMQSEKSDNEKNAELAEKMRKKYGETTFNKLAKRNFELGMTKEMVRDALIYNNTNFYSVSTRKEKGAIIETWTYSRAKLEASDVLGPGLMLTQMFTSRMGGQQYIEAAIKGKMKYRIIKFKNGKLIELVGF